MKTVDDFKILLHELQQRHENGEFGTAIFPADCGITEENELYYTAPEVTKDHTDERSDIFTVTAIFYTSLTGRAPWGGCCDNIRSSRQRKVMLRLQRQMNPVDVSSVIEVFRPIISKGLAVDPAERYATIADMLHDLESIPEAEHVEPLLPQLEQSKVT